MRSVNKVILIGNLTKDPVIKTTERGQKIVTFTLATNREWVDSSGEKKSLAEFHNIAVWGRLADICEKYLKKGKLIFVEGYLKTRYWESPEGIRLSRTEIVAYDMVMLNKRDDIEIDDNIPMAEKEILESDIFDGIGEEIFHSSEDGDDSFELPK